jgi:hypothetical protein
MSGAGALAVDVRWSCRPRPSAAGRASFQRLQALDDAIAYRRARVAAPCPDCDPAPGGRKCDDHACDLMLIADYHRAAQVIDAEIESARQHVCRRRQQ